jgi:hypothetical protein
MPVRVTTENVGHQPGVSRSNLPLEDHRASERDLRPDLEAPTGALPRTRPESVGGVRDRDLSTDPDRRELCAEPDDRE